MITGLVGVKAMGGHSHWSQIKRQKGTADARRGQLFTKLAREITVATRQGGGGDPSMNPRLRLAIDKARSYNMPLDNIDRAIKRGLGQTGEAELVETIYEGYGPGGIAIMVEALTDNRNRTAADVRAAFSRGGGSLGEAGCVSWLFENKGVISVAADDVDDPDAVGLQAIDAGADDVETEGDAVEIYTDPDRLDEVRRALEAEDIPIASADVTMVPKSTVPLDDKDSLQALKLLDRLEELDDVQRVYSNAEFSDAVLAEYAASH